MYIVEFKHYASSGKGWYIFYIRAGERDQMQDGPFDNLPAAQAEADMLNMDE